MTLRIRLGGVLSVRLLMSPLIPRILWLILSATKTIDLQRAWHLELGHVNNYYANAGLQ